jgi:hypothetical protein
MAATLNTLSIQAIGGSVPANVQDALTQGEILLETYEHQTDIKGKDAKSIRSEFTYYAGILRDFDEGTIGPGHSSAAGGEPGSARQNGCPHEGPATTGPSFVSGASCAAVRRCTAVVDRCRLVY